MLDVHRGKAPAPAAEPERHFCNGSFLTRHKNTVPIQPLPYCQPLGLTPPILGAARWSGCKRLPPRADRLFLTRFQPFQGIAFGDLVLQVPPIHPKMIHKKRLARMPHKTTEQTAPDTNTREKRHFQTKRPSGKKRWSCVSAKNHSPNPTRKTRKGIFPPDPPSARKDNLRFSTSRKRNPSLSRQTTKSISDRLGSPISLPPGAFPDYY